LESEHAYVHEFRKTDLEYFIKEYAFWVFFSEINPSVDKPCTLHLSLIIKTIITTVFHWFKRWKTRQWYLLRNILEALEDDRRLSWKA